MSEENPTPVAPQSAPAPIDLAPLFAALAAAQAEFPVIKTNKTAIVKIKQEKGGGEYSYNYGSLDSILDALRGPLAKNGLTLRHILRAHEDAMWVEAVLGHSSGGQLRSGAIPVPRWSNMQELGGGLTYARRYTTNALLGICPEDDTDGANAPTGNPFRDKNSRGNGEGKASSKKDNAEQASAAAAKTWTADEVLEKIAATQTAKGLAEFLTERVGAWPVTSKTSALWKQLGGAAKKKLDAADWPDVQKALVIAVLDGIRNQLQALAPTSATPAPAQEKKADAPAAGDASKAPSLDRVAGWLDQLESLDEVQGAVNTIESASKYADLRANPERMLEVIRYVGKNIVRPKVEGGQWAAEAAGQLMDDLVQLETKYDLSQQATQAFSGGTP